MKDQENLCQLYTPEGEELLLAGEDFIPWNVYPRPHMRRESFVCLNGWWDFALSETGEIPDAFGERIRVPFVPQSPLSGIGRAIPQRMTLCYRRIFSLPQGGEGERTILHFGGADQIARVYLNGALLGEHVGGYQGFSFDVTKYLAEENELTVLVRDELDKKILPYGKQKEKRGGMWYTPVSGIWQTVWLERVPVAYIRELSVVTEGDSATVSVDFCGREEAQGELILRLSEGDLRFPLVNGHAHVKVPQPILWSPENPHLYEISLRVGEDRVDSYFALRTLETKTVNGKPRLCLNGEPCFFHGLLDQGYFSDGIFLPASPEGYERDILAAKALGFNTLRKHIKVEPEQFYYDCDRLGMVVFQDMVNNGDYSFLRDTALPTVGVKRRNDRRLHKDWATREAFLHGMEETVKRLSHHPSICYWTIFNEGWGQFDHAAAYDRLRALDSTRWIDSVSGWFLPPKGDAVSDVDSAHVYFKPYRFTPTRLPAVLSEFGGYAYGTEGHLFNPNKSYGYRTFSTQEELESAILSLYREQIIPAAEAGLCAAVYTQLSDVEDEINGLLTYDRKVEKVSRESMLAIAEALSQAVRK